MLRFICVCLEFKEILCVMVADAGNDFAESFIVCGIFAVFYPAADEVT